MKVVNTYIPGIPSQIPEAYLMTVLTQGDCGNFACYIGIVSLPPATADDYAELREQRADFLATHGAKQSHKQALAYYPQVPEDQYRK